MTTAFVLGGGGLLGAVEVGMLQALLEVGIKPDLVLGSSVGALNGAAIAGDPSLATVELLSTTWEALGQDQVFGGGRLTTLARSRTHLHGNDRLRMMLDRHGAGVQIEDLLVPFQCVAACIETAGAHWFSTGPVTDAVLASTAVPGLLPPVRIGDRHYLDGGLVHSIPVGRAFELGATTVYVLQVGRVEQPLSVPRWPWEVAAVAFEIARRHRFTEEMARIPEGADVHVLPAGKVGAPLTTLRYRDTSRVRARIASAHEASAEYLHG
ncbi:MAG: hypothetical protein JWN31_491 [Frankiales bacterium]|nr:hypothetical protein [Frankiales bacterium]